MSSISALQSGLQGIHKGLAGLERNAANIASVKQFTSDGPEELVGSLIGLKVNRLQIEMSAQVVKVADETIGTLLDILA